MAWRPDRRFLSRIHRWGSGSVAHVPQQASRYRRPGRLTCCPMDDRTEGLLRQELLAVQLRASFAATVAGHGRGLPFRGVSGNLTLADPQFFKGWFRRARRTAAAGQLRTVRSSKNVPDQSPLRVSSQTFASGTSDALEPRRQERRISAPVSEFAWV